MTACLFDQRALTVAIVSTQRHWHGGETQAALLATGLSERGHDVHILARAGGAFEERMRAKGYPVVAFNGRGRSPRALWQLRQSLLQMRPDVVHANDAHALTASGLASWRLPVPLRVAARRVDFPLRSRWRYQHLADGLLCVSTSVAQVCEAGGLDPTNLHIVHDGVAPEFAASGIRARGRQSLRLVDEERLLLTVAKLTDHKGHTYLLQALPELLQRYPKIVVAFAGDGELRESLEQEAAARGVAPHVRFLDYRHDIPDLLAAADVIVQPSHLEGLCSSLIDAMLAARPIVASAAGGIPDLVSERPEEAPVAWLVPPKSPTALVTALEQVLADPTEAQARGSRARQRALREFTADHMVDQTLDAYRTIADRRSHAAPRWPATARSASRAA